MSSNRSCLICTAPSTYEHCGVASCRSCADFFKRTVKAGLSFPCRLGEGKCTINPHDRHNCRGCRFEKCKSLGMKFDTNKIDRSTSKRKSSPTLSQCQIRADQTTRFEAPTFIDHTSFCKTASLNSKTPLLDRIRNGFSFMCLVRLTEELRITRGARETLQVDNLVLSLSSYSTMIPVYRQLHVGLYEFANIAFEQFKALDTASKKLIVIRRLTCIELLESTYRSCHHFPYDFETRLPGYTTYYSQNDFEKVFATCEDDIDKPKLMSEWRKALKQLSRMVRYHFEHTKLTDYEFLALLGLAFWTDESGDETIRRISSQVRPQILRELHVYYKERGITDYASRIGKIFCLLMNGQECSAKVEEDFELFRLLKMFDNALRISHDICT